MQQGEEKCQPTLRLCQIERPSSGSCGFHLSRTAWDPYPWVSGVECGSAADFAGLQPGDCVLEVNSHDVLGQRIGEVASKVRARDGVVTLLLWNAGSDPQTAANNISGNGPTPVSLQRLSNCLQSVLQLLECPVCLETIPPPAVQCCHGHVLCGRCRSRADKCPVCRVSLGPKGRCLLADKLHSLLTSVLHQNHKKKQLYNKHKRSFTQQIQLPFHLKSRIGTDLLFEAEPQQAGCSSDQQDGNPILIHAKSSSEENISYTAVRCEANQSPSEEQALRIRSVSAEQIPIIMNPQHCTEKQLPVNQIEKLPFHCPYPSKSHGYCSEVSIGPQDLLKHLRETHTGPLVQYFLKPSRSVVKLRLPLSSSKPPSSFLTSFTTNNNTVFFVQVAAAASPGQRLVWLWLVGDSAQSEKYRLRLTLPEGDTHTGPVFPLTSSWNEVVNSNCCLSIEESRYNSGNPEVRLEILNVANN